MPNVDCCYYNAFVVNKSNVLSGEEEASKTCAMEQIHHHTSPVTESNTRKGKKIQRPTRDRRKTPKENTKVTGETATELKAKTK